MKSINIKSIAFTAAFAMSTFGAVAEDQNV